ncbi:hypothetical protein SO802_023918 [Lithocarpus litseifolius]|uniref:Uncharacterized protein n=1 Tax=Lithocarpus litseifolius TaxID=425828 RepID=A0AAW2CCW7_9ROSI
MGTPMGGFFSWAGVVLATPVPVAVAPEIPTKVPIPPTEPVSIGESAYMEKVGATVPTPTEMLTPQKGVIPSAISQAEIASPVTPLVISISDPFITLSQAVKDDSSLVVTPSSIPSSATRGPNADLSSEGSENVLEDSDDEPTVKKRISDSKEEKEEGAERVGEPMEISKELGVAADTDMPTATPPATPVAPIPVIFSVPTFTGSDPVSEAVAFFTRFDQLEVNDLDPVDFWSSSPPYVDFHSFRVPEDCVSHLEAIYSNREDPSVESYSSRAYKRRLRCGVYSGSSPSFQPAFDAIDTRIEVLKKGVADLEARYERLLSSIGESSRFGDQSLISGLR